MKKLILHIGTHKTGTTSIQNRLNNSIIEGYKVIDINDFNRLGSYDDFILLSNYLNDNIDNYIVSCERFSGELFKGYYDVGNILSNFSKLESKYNIHIVVFYREHIEFIESVYSQYLHQGGVGSFDEFISKLNLENFQYTNHIRLIKSSFPNSIISVLEYNHDTVNTFFNEVNVKVSKEKIVLPNKNISYGIEGLLIAAKYNAFLTKNEKVELRTAIQTHLPKKRSDKRTVIPVSTYEKLEKQFLSDKKIMNNEFGFSLSNKDVEFVNPDAYHDLLNTLVLKVLLEDRNKSKVIDLIKNVELKFLNWLYRHTKIKNIIKNIYIKVR